MSEVYYKILLVGGSGEGKTYSARNMDKVKTHFVNVENKPLPFKGSFKHTETPSTVEEVLEALKTGSKNEETDCIFVDSFSAYLDLNMAECRKNKKGFDIYTTYNDNIARFHDFVKKCKKEVFVIAHYEIISDEITGKKEKRVKSNGKQWEGWSEKEYTIVLYAESKVVPGKRPTHHFTLVNDGSNSAKCPPDIFGMDTLTIDNDTNLVLKKIQEFKK
jgi:hypothetical protein